MSIWPKILHEIPHRYITVGMKARSDWKKVKENIPFLANISVTQEINEYPLLNEKTTYYICKNHACLPPTNDFPMVL